MNMYLRFMFIFLLCTLQIFSTYSIAQIFTFIWHDGGGSTHKKMDIGPKPTLSTTASASHPESHIVTSLPTILKF